jgi:hypothetical protein
MKSAAAKTLPLFESAKRARLKTLCVRRFEDGQWVRAPQSFRDDELSDREAVRARFGGGRYEVIARDGRQIVARTRFVLDGAPCPLRDEPPSPAAQAIEPMAFATQTGAREALIFGLFNEGLDVVEITQRTRIDARTVRAVFAEWLTPLGLEPVKSPEEIPARRALVMKLRSQALQAEWEGTWTSSK